MYPPRSSCRPLSFVTFVVNEYVRSSRKIGHPAVAVAEGTEAGDELRIAGVTRIAEAG